MFYAILVCLLIILGLVILLVKINGRKVYLEGKYSQIIDIDTEKEKLEKEVNTFRYEFKKEAAECKEKREKEIDEYNKKREKYKSEFHNAEQLIQKMRKEISTLEESIEIIDCGLYKPHFDFQTSAEYKKQLEKIYEQEKDFIKANRAVTCDTEWTVGGSKAEGKKMTQKNHKLMLRAFNGECDSAISKIRWDNVKKMEERIKKSYETINKTGEINRSRITSEYLYIKLQELHATYEHQEKIKQEKDEQKRIQEEMREEEKARREYEKAQEEAEKEEIRYQKALAKAQEELSKASDGKVSALNEKIQQLQEQLRIAHENKERAISQAQLTKSGHIYVISNIGSFGENIFKIGMTRRLEPMDRITELSNASVPFPFDIHAMIYSEDAPGLEKALHKHFAEKSLNLINMRKEFFSITIDEIEEWAGKNRCNFNITKIAEAREYNETMSIRNKGKDKIHEVVKKEEEFSYSGIFSED